ncbi:hypothetical protein SAMN05421788_105300 [Filimonas lacunae]|uniref:Uncharacterized protein n=1 Tax=Filimonas lacunae TaxID=477680 RepID=A0A173MCD8_9BACT|nr:hypothetical protein [Filimonas lacunae]BAV05243.1 hypothetical protein FLA_1250 [Filimonas lacunae]SIT22425.1 hypothetical protein SAMN05421788_105300 [Filimonas lacunae]
MIKFNEMQPGDFVIAEYEGQRRMGEVTGLDHSARLVGVETDVQEFWYAPEHVHPISITDESLSWLNFTKEVQSNGSVKYKKGSFRLWIPAPDQFSALEIWYREDQRTHPDVHYVHQLQNHYLQMTKIPLTREVMV